MRSRLIVGKTSQDVREELANADSTSLTREDEAATTGDDSPEFNPMLTFGRPRAPKLESIAHGTPADPEEIFKLEVAAARNAYDTLPMTITRKMETEEEAARRALEEIRLEQERREEEARMKPVNQTPIARLPPRALPPGHPANVNPSQPPQIPGAATHPENPFAGYQQPASAPQSGLPWKPPGSGGGEFGKGYKPTRYEGRLVTEAIKHDCLTVHGYTPHEEWMKHEMDYSQIHPDMLDYQDHPGESCDDAHPDESHDEWLDDQNGDGNSSNNQDDDSQDGDDSSSDDSDFPESKALPKQRAGEPQSPPKGYPSNRTQYADPANYKYPLDTEAHVRAAWSYINQAKNRGKYEGHELATMESRIKKAARRFGIKISDDKE